jgi:hypothetical protein
MQPRCLSVALALVAVACSGADPILPDVDASPADDLVVARVPGFVDEITVIARDGSGPWRVVERSPDGLYRFPVHTGRYTLGAVCAVDDQHAFATVSALDTEQLSLIVPPCFWPSPPGFNFERSISGSVTMDAAAWIGGIAGSAAGMWSFAVSQPSGAFSADLPDDPSATAIFVGYGDSTSSTGVRWAIRHDLGLGDVSLDLDLDVDGKPFAPITVEVDNALAETGASASLVVAPDGYLELYTSEATADAFGRATLMMPAPTDLIATDRVRIRAWDHRSTTDGELSRAVRRDVAPDELADVQVALLAPVSQIRREIVPGTGGSRVRAELAAVDGAASYTMTYNERLTAAVTSAYAGETEIIQLATVDPVELAALGLWDPAFDAELAAPWTMALDVVDAGPRAATRNYFEYDPPAAVAPRDRGADPAAVQVHVEPR